MNQDQKVYPVYLHIYNQYTLYNIHSTHSICTFAGIKLESLQVGDENNGGKSLKEEGELSGSDEEPIRPTAKGTAVLDAWAPHPHAHACNKHTPPYA